MANIDGAAEGAADGTVLGAAVVGEAVGEAVPLTLLDRPPLQLQLLLW
jgi:hypothetical protein